MVMHLFVRMERSKCIRFFLFYTTNDRRTDSFLLRFVHIFSSHKQFLSFFVFFPDPKFYNRCVHWTSTHTLFDKMNKSQMRWLERREMSTDSIRHQCVSIWSQHRNGTLHLLTFNNTEQIVMKERRIKKFIYILNSYVKRVVKQHLFSHTYECVFACMRV